MGERDYRMKISVDPHMRGEPAGRPDYAPELTTIRAHAEALAEALEALLLQDDNPHWSDTELLEKWGRTKGLAIGAARHALSAYRKDVP